MTTSIRLVGCGRAASIEVTDALVKLRVPGVFGKAPWQIPIAQVGVCNMANLDLLASDDGESPVFEDEIRIPYLETSPIPAPPSLCLLFRSRLRVPALPRFGMSEQLPRRASRSTEGVWLDGVCLRAQDPVAALIALQGAGAERVTDPEAWLVARRAVVTDPVERGVIEHETVAAKRAGLIFLLGLVLVIAMRVVAAYETALWAAVVAGIGALLVVASAIFGWWSRRKHRRILAATRGEAEPGRAN